MNKKDGTCAAALRVFCGGLFLLTLAGIAIRTLNLMLFYEAEIGYYYADAVLPVVMNIFLLAVFATIGVCSIIIPKKPYTTSGTEINIATRVSAALCALAFLTLAVCALLGFVDNAFPITYILAVSSSAAAAYFILWALGKTNSSNVLLTVTIIISLVYVLAASYFDIFVQMNSPNKTLTQLACIASMLFFIYEARAVTGEKKSKLYVFSLSCALFFAGMASFPAIIAYLTDNLGNYFISINYIVFDILFAILFVYYAARVVTLMITADKDEETDLSAYGDMYVFPEEAEAAEAESVAEETVAEEPAAEEYTEQETTERN